MHAFASRAMRYVSLAALSSYCFLLLASAVPAQLIGARPLWLLQLGAGFSLHSLGVTPGLEVFKGKTSLHAIHKMTCFRIVGDGQRSIVLYDDLALCRERGVQPVRDPFRILQMRQLSAALADLNLGGRRDLTRDLLQPLFLFSDYYCHLPPAEQARVERVTIEALYVGLDVQDGTTGEVMMYGSRDCRQPTWVVGR